MALKTTLTPLAEPTPLIPLLHNRTSSIKMQGPTEASLLILLWENMLCRLSPKRMENKEVGGSTRFSRAMNSTELVRRVIPRLSATPDRVWRAVMAQTAVVLDEDIHANLWASFADPKTGELPEENLSAHITSKMPTFLLKMSGRAKSFISMVLQGDQPLKEYAAPGLRLRVEPVSLVLRDPDNLIHCQDGPAAIFLDGTAVCFWRGTAVPTEWIPEAGEEWRRRNGNIAVLTGGRGYKPPTPEQALREENMELRRAACEILGWDNVIDGLKPAIVDTDEDPEIGQLVWVTFPPANSWQMPAQQMFLRVRCGTGRSFALAVPPDMKTARQANAWTYGLTEDEYQPEART